MSIRRLQKFMMYDEVTPPETETVKQNSNANENSKSNAKEKVKENKENAKENSKESSNENTNKIAKEELAADESRDDDKIAHQTNCIDYCISIKNGTTKWLEHEREDTLQNITMKVRPGELIAVVGQVGAGKSSLLNVILKELRLQEGSVQVSL